MTCSFVYWGWLIWNYGLKAGLINFWLYFMDVKMWNGNFVKNIQNNWSFFGCEDTRVKPEQAKWCLKAS